MRHGKEILPISVSLAAPAYNEGSSISVVLDNWIKYLDTLSYLADYEIVVCNDGSIDQTGAILEKHSRDNPRIRILHFEKNQGAAAALAHAVLETKMDYVLLIDSDGQFPIQFLEEMIGSLMLESETSAVIGVRESKQGSLFGRFGTWISGALCNLVYGTHYKDFNSAFKLVPGNVLRSLNLEARGLNYSTEITAKLIERGVLFVEVPVQHTARIGGKSSMKLVQDSWNRFLFVFYLALRKALVKLKVLKKVI